MFFATIANGNLCCAQSVMPSISRFENTESAIWRFLGGFSVTYAQRSRIDMIFLYPMVFEFFQDVISGKHNLIFLFVRIDNTRLSRK